MDRTCSRALTLTPNIWTCSEDFALPSDNCQWHRLWANKIELQMVSCPNAKSPILLQENRCVPANIGNVRRFAGSWDPPFLARKRPSSHSKKCVFSCFLCLLLAWGFLTRVIHSSPYPDLRRQGLQSSGVLFLFFLAHALARISHENVGI